MSAPSSRRNSHPANAPQALLLLEDIRLIVGEETGALAFGKDGQSLGVVLLEKGKICWATTQRTRNRLADLLIKKSQLALSRNDIEAAYIRCRESGAPLLSALAETCQIDAKELLDVLCEHTVEALRELSSVKFNARFFPHRQKGFGATYGFEFPELYVKMCSAADNATCSEAKNLLKRIVSEGGFALAFAADSDGAPLAVCGSNWLRLTDLAELSSWARSTLDIGGVLGTQATSVVLSSPQRDSVLLWTHGDLVVICFCQNDAALAYALTQTKALDPTKSWSTSAVAS